ncbi:MAG: hypothetical protein HYZ72_02565 [Deltaproteobacteria bacterium]|nr:hypothetical protein [Deltaproteobacteria bacterium]
MMPPFCTRGGKTNEYRFPAPMRARFTDPAALDPAFVPVFAWRDQIYRKHRGGPVRP